MSSKFNDTLSILTGGKISKDKKVSVTKKVDTKKSSEQKPAVVTNASTADILRAFEYAGKSADLSKDIKSALKGEPITPELENLLTILKPNAPKVSKPTDSKLHLEYKFIGKDDGKNKTKEAEALLSLGRTLEELDAFNIVLYAEWKDEAGNVSREANDEEYLQVLEELKKKYPNKK